MQPDRNLYEDVGMSVTINNADRQQHEYKNLYENVDYYAEIQPTLVISTSIISNNRLSRRENLVLVLTKKSYIR